MVRGKKCGTVKIGKSMMAAFLAFLLGAGTLAPCVLAEPAETVSDNSVAEESVIGDPGSGISGEGTENAVDIVESGDSVSANGVTESGIQETAQKTPQNPIHYCSGQNDGTDLTVWSYVYFGSYPQREVTDQETKIEIDTAMKEGDTPIATYMEGTDIWIGDKKYRVVGKNHCNNTDHFGNQPGAYRYFEWEPIKWRVLQNDGSTLFLIADTILECKNYNDEWDIVPWEECTLRKWLDEKFYRQAFSSEEQEAIVPQTVVNENNLYWGTRGGNTTTDRVYCLSTREITSEALGFCSDDSVNSVSRRFKSSAYANARGVYRSPFRGYEGNSWWWQRSPGKYEADAMFVGDEGHLFRDGTRIDNNNFGVAPVVRISLASGLWTMVDNVLGDAENPIHCHTDRNDGSDNTTWSYVYFGAYPQGEVTDEATKQAIDSAIAQGKGQAAGTADKSEGIDVWVNDTKYRRIAYQDCNSFKYFKEVEDVDYRYFKWERIRWRVLKNDGSTLFVMADRAIDCKNYNDVYIDITWENCTLRTWLNGIFYKTAFNSAEKEAIVAQTVVNKDNSEHNTEGGNDTTDKVYLLSGAEVKDTSLGFCSSYCFSASRRLKASDYAHARGVYRSPYTEYEEKENCYWWLRSPGLDGRHAAYVPDKGVGVEDGGYIDKGDFGVAPVLHINFSSDLWLVADDGTSGGGGGSPDEGGDESPDDGGNGTGGSGSAQISKVKASAITLTGISKKIAAGKKISLGAEVLPKDATDKSVIWTSSNPKYATVDANGVAKMNKAGAGKTVTITATAKDGSGVCAQYQIKIMKHTVKKVKITASSKKVKAGGKLKLKAAVETTGKNANKKLKWISSNEGYATVSSGGVVKTTKAGKGKTVTITAMATDGSGKKSKVTIKIK